MGLAWRQNDNVQATERALKCRGGLIFFFVFFVFLVYMYSSSRYMYTAAAAVLFFICYVCAVCFVYIFLVGSAISIFSPLLFGWIETSFPFLLLFLSYIVSDWTHEKRMERDPSGSIFLYFFVILAQSLGWLLPGEREKRVRNGMQTTNDMVMSGTIYKMIDPIVWSAPRAAGPEGRRRWRRRREEFDAPSARMEDYSRLWPKRNFFYFPPCSNCDRSPLLRVRFY